jgi:multiple sugar transport system substrate-binding protein
VKTLRGMTWNHDRGLKPMLATAALFEQQNSGVRVSWEARSLQEFADFPVDELAKRYDLIVLDHPHMGTAARDGCLVPLNKYISPLTRATLQQESVGKSYQSYLFDNELWALPIDAAAQVAAYRPDLLERLQHPVPGTWDDVIALARLRPGTVCVPLMPTDALMAFFTLCANSGEEPFSASPRIVVTDKTGLAALEMLKQLASYSIPESLSWNPVQMWESMASTDITAYCPLAFGYSNYARSGYRPNILKFTNIPVGLDGLPSGSILGGTGLGISSMSQHMDLAIEYAVWVSQAACQSTIYFSGGGQPANRVAWTSDFVNRESNEFFRNTIGTLDHAYLRPNWTGFIDFQNAAFGCMKLFLNNQADSEATLSALNHLAANCRSSFLENQGDIVQRS